MVVSCFMGVRLRVLQWSTEELSKLQPPQAEADIWQKVFDLPPTTVLDLDKSWDGLWYLLSKKRREYLLSWHGPTKEKNQVETNTSVPNTNVFSLSSTKPLSLRVITPPSGQWVLDSDGQALLGADSLRTSKIKTKQGDNDDQDDEDKFEDGVEDDDDSEEDEGAFRATRPEQLIKLTVGWRAITKEKLLRLYDAEEFMRLGVYPMIWQEDSDGEDWLWDSFIALRSFSERATAQRLSLLYLLG